VPLEAKAKIIDQSGPVLMMMMMATARSKLHRNQYCVLKRGDILAHFLFHQHGRKLKRAIDSMVHDGHGDYIASRESFLHQTEPSRLDELHAQQPSRRRVAFLRIP
jgi:hypothetical protein